MARDLLTSFGRPGWRIWAAAILGVVVVLAVLVARLAGGGGESSSESAAGSRPASEADGPSDQATPGSDTDRSSPADPDAGYDGPDGQASDVPTEAPAAARAVAQEFTAAWANHPEGIKAEDWWRNVSQYTDEALADSLRVTDPQRVPASEVTGSAETVSTARNRALFAVPTDVGPLQVTCVLLQGEWKVTSIDMDPSAGAGQ